MKQTLRWVSAVQARDGVAPSVYQSIEITDQAFRLEDGTVIKFAEVRQVRVETVEFDVEGMPGHFRTNVLAVTFKGSAKTIRLTGTLQVCVMAKPFCAAISLLLERTAAVQPSLTFREVKNRAQSGYLGILGLISLLVAAIFTVVYVKLAFADVPVMERPTLMDWAIAALLPLIPSAIGIALIKKANRSPRTGIDPLLVAKQIVNLRLPYASDVRSWVADQND